MNILTIPKIILTPSDGWHAVEASSPSLPAVIAHVLPLSMLPPLLLYYAGTHELNDTLAGLGYKPWATIAVLFYFVEVLCCLGMGWLVGQVAETYRIRVPSRDAHLLAFITPTPLWLASLALLASDFAVSATALLMALAASCCLMYRGIRELCHLHEEILALYITQAVLGAAFVAWVPLLLLILAL